MSSSDGLVEWIEHVCRIGSAKKKLDVVAEMERMERNETLEMSKPLVDWCEVCKTIQKPSKVKVPNE
jgi:hypothetical protein